MSKNIFYHNVKLVPLNVQNNKPNIFRTMCNEIPYLLYEVENLSTGEKIAINKPGGKRSFGRLARNDFMVFIYSPENESLWLISHDEILEDLREKYKTNKSETEKLISCLLEVCNGAEVDMVIEQKRPIATVGLEPEKLLKVYKWIWGQEDCNYPNGEGRWRSMNTILKEFNLEKK